MHIHTMARVLVPCISRAWSRLYLSASACSGGIVEYKLPVRHFRAQHACQPAPADVGAMLLHLSVYTGLLRQHAVAVNAGMLCSFCDPKAVFSPSPQQPFLPHMPTEVPCVAATCRCAA
jgi:hypothetical protein